MVALTDAAAGLEAARALTLAAHAAAGLFGSSGQPQAARACRSAEALGRVAVALAVQFRDSLRRGSAEGAVDSDSRRSQGATAAESSPPPRPGGGSSKSACRRRRRQQRRHDMGGVQEEMVP